MTLVKKNFYARPDVVNIARELLGKLLITQFDGKRSSGIITETEAYEGITDRASHAYSGRRSERTEIMYRVGELLTFIYAMAFIRCLILSQMLKVYHMQFLSGGSLRLMGSNICLIERVKTKY